MTRRQILRSAAALAAAPLAPLTSYAQAEKPSGASSEGRPVFRTDAANLAARYEAAVLGLAGNIARVFNFSSPVLKEGARYPGVWLECAPQEGLVYAPFNSAVALSNHRIFFDLQRPDGQLPFGVFSNRAGFSQIQMVVPIAATALELFERTRNEEFLARAYRAAGKWDAWLSRYRNTRGTGLCELFCGYDTGEDGSARFKGLPWKCPNDDARICPKAGELPYLAPDLSATVYGGRLALARMARLLGESAEASSWNERAETIRAAIMKWCFDPEDLCFYDVDARGHFVRIRCVELLVTLGEHVVSQDLFDAIYRRHIRSPQEFWTPFPFPSVAPNDPAFNHALPENCWGGPSQVLTALRAPRWMEFYGKHADLAFLMKRWIRAIAGCSEFEQQIDPWTGAFSTGTAYSPCMLLLLDFVARLYGVRWEKETIQWNCRSPEGAVESFYSAPTPRGAAELAVRKSSGVFPASLTLAGRRCLSVEGIARVTTNLDGKPTSLVGTEPAETQVVLHWPDGRTERRSVSPDETVQL